MSRNISASTEDRMFDLLAALGERAPLEPFGRALLDVRRYIDFVELLRQELDELGQQLVEQNRRLQAAHAAPDPPAGTPDLARLELHALMALQNPLHLRHEAAILFAAIALDRMAVAVEYLFGRGRRFGKRYSLSSHRRLSENLTRYAERLELDPPPALLLEKIEICRTRIGSIRDDDIVHKLSSRFWWASVWSTTGQTSLIHTLAGAPKPGDQLKQTDPPVELLRLVCEYIDEMLAYMSQNLDRARAAPVEAV